MTFTDYIIYLFNFALGIGAILALVMIISAGIKIVESKGSPSEISNAKQKIINSLIGLAVLLASYILLTTINPEIINIQNISLGNTGITIPVITPATQEEAVNSYSFEEIPIGTITEGILAGTSSKTNNVPCYEYETDIYGSDSSIIIGNTIDKNNDGKINEDDLALNQDIMYCVKSLNKAIKDKTETHLKILTSQLTDLMKSGCSCQNCYYKHFWYEPYDCAVTNAAPCIPYIQDCSNYKVTPAQCSTCNTYCGCCGSYGVGCAGASQDKEVAKKYSPCNNEEAINCKRQEIKQLIDGTKPDQVCYDKGLVAPVNEQTVLTYQTAISRLLIFKQYYLDQVSKLEEAELKMKSPEGERITLAELNKIESSSTDIAVSKTAFGDYDISRYCDDYCTEYGTVDGKRTCIKHELNKEKRVCRMDDSGEEYYRYSGDGATFYFSSAYNTAAAQKNALIEQKDNECDIEEQDASNEMYGGLIPIGETVDSTEDWGNEVARLLQEMTDEVKGIAKVAVDIADFPTKCDCGNNCQQSVPVSCCVCSCKGDNCCPDATCQTNICSTCEPKAAYKDSACNTVQVSYFTGCYSCSKKRPPVYSYKSQSKPQYYVCPFDDLCGYVKKIYQSGEISNSCFDPSSSDSEESAKATARNSVGYLKRFEMREKRLFALSELGNLDNGTFTDDAAVLFPNLDCLTGCSATSASDDLSCESTFKKEIPGRFELLDKLKLSRERLTGCVNGYGYPYKESSNEVRVFSCYEGVNSSLVILPEFPYPDMSQAKDKDNNSAPYINCYPYNSDELTAEQKEICFYNINRTGTESNPGCLTITKSYMDNYYCCQ